jgi:hypothetical protein
MMTPLKLLNLRNSLAPHLDDHLLRDLGVSRIASEFALHAPFALERVEYAKTFLDKWVAQNVPDNAAPDKRMAMKLALRCIEDARRRGITKDELEKAAGEEMADCMIDAQMAGAETKVGDLFE